MATPCYISINGKVQGLITKDAFTVDSVGNSFVQGHENEMLVQEFSHIVNIPTDVQSGQPSGQRRHQPFKFTVNLNKAIPLMYNSLTTGEILDKVELKWYRTSTEGRQEHFFSTILEDAVITSINCQLPNCLVVDNAQFTQLVEVALSYRKITWSHLLSSTSGSDDWRAPI